MHFKLFLDKFVNVFFKILVSIWNLGAFWGVLVWFAAFLCLFYWSESSLYGQEIDVKKS